MKSLLFLIILLLPLLLSSQEYKGEVQSLPIQECQNLTLKESKFIDKICIKSVKVRYRIFSLFGEPVEQYNVYWEISPVIYLRTGAKNIESMPKNVQKAFNSLTPIDPTKFCISATAKGFGRFYFTFSGGVLGKSAKGYSFDTPGSPSWDKFIVLSLPMTSVYFPTLYMAEKEAKRAFVSLNSFIFESICNLTFSGISDLNYALDKTLEFSLNISVFDKKDNRRLYPDIYIEDINTKYKDYMSLKSGFYKLKIMNKGYKTLYKTIHFDNEHKNFTFTLEKVDKNSEKQKAKIEQKPQQKVLDQKKKRALKKESKQVLKNTTKATKKSSGKITTSIDFKKKKLNKKALNLSNTDTEASILMLIDVSGSMSGEKLDNAKQAARASIDAAIKNHTEVAILTFSGSCDSPIAAKIGFTKNKKTLVDFVNSLSAGGSTPLGSALKKANYFMKKNKSAASKMELILLLADGEGSCGNVNNVLRDLKAQEIVFRHETIGLGVQSNSKAARELRHIADTTGGSYHHTNNPKQLKKIFLEALDTVEILDMIGKFGGDGMKKVQEQGNMENILDIME